VDVVGPLISVRRPAQICSTPGSVAVSGSGPGVRHDLELVLTSLAPVSNMRGHKSVRRSVSTDGEPSNWHVEGRAATA
jgi:hypothetical protein